ncbi:MAG: hypothetical protein U9R72_00840 [Chloroflexota bacterium]|nr:hypothetical protein [Chloroflexota bacterium]
MGRGGGATSRGCVAHYERVTGRYEWAGGGGVAWGVVGFGKYGNRLAGMETCPTADAMGGRGAWRTRCARHYKRAGRGLVGPAWMAPQRGG